MARPLTLKDCANGESERAQRGSVWGIERFLQEVNLRTILISYPL
jgi:hypothetical protein